MAISKQSDQKAVARRGLSRLEQGDTMIVLKIPGVLLSQEQGRAVLHAASSTCEWQEGGDGEFMHLCHGVDAPETYLYIVPPTVAEHDVSKWIDESSRLQRSAASFYPGAQAVVLEVVQAVDGASIQQTPAWHYVVETDVRPRAEDDFNDWYAQEHLPGLAAVPGTVRALRCRSLSGAPRYHAFYLLETRETFGSEPWLKVRGTEWSSRVRPNFTNTKRTMFKIQTH